LEVPCQSKEEERWQLHSKSCHWEEEVQLQLQLWWCHLEQEQHWLLLFFPLTKQLQQLLGQWEEEEQRQLLLHFEHQEEEEPRLPQDLLLQLPCQLQEEERWFPHLLPFQWEEEAHWLPQHCLEEQQ